MKKIGIVGGVGWRSTVDYYTRLCERSERRWLAMGSHGVPSLPHMCIESLDLAQAIAYLGRDADEESWLRFDGYHRAALSRLAASGADFALLASNTPHERFDSIVRGVEIPVIDLFTVMAQACARLDAPQTLILGTRCTMSSVRLRNEFAKVGVAAQDPGDETARAEIVELIRNLQLGKSAGAAKSLSDIARRSCREFTMQPTVCLACTELALAFPEHQGDSVFELDGVRYLNTACLHVDAAFAMACEARAGAGIQAPHTVSAPPML